jgi:aspartate kinase
VAIDSRETGERVGRDLIEEISLFAAASIESGKAIISLVGEELRSDTAVAGRVFKAIDEIQLGVILHGSSPISMNLVVDERDVERAIARLHEVFFSNMDLQVFE